MSLEVKTDNIQTKGRLAIEMFYHRGVAGLLYEADRLLGLMKERTPEKTGKLKSTGVVTSQFDGNEHVAIISFGDSDTDYAIPVHERIQAKHQVGQAKFMESVLQEESERIPQNISNGIISL